MPKAKRPSKKNQTRSGGNAGGGSEEGGGDDGKNPAAVALGRLGGLKGGKARAKSLTPSERSQAAQKAARSRWGKSED
jgi:hypothetical protein